MMLFDFAKEKDAEVKAPEKKTILGVLVLATSVVLTGLAPAGQALAGDKGQRCMEDGVKDAWLHGKLETAYALNRHLNPFTIDTEVNAGVAHLSGTVKSDIDKDLAEQVALSLEGINEVKNDLQVVSDASAKSKSESAAAKAGQRTFSERVEDATITASVKTKLLMNRHTKGLAVNVDTESGVVTLTGAVGSTKEKTLAEVLAKNTQGVAEVVNNMTVEGRG